MHDIRKVRENPEAFDAALARRGVAPVSASLLALDDERKALGTLAQDIQSKRNAVAKEVGNRKARGEDASDLIEEVSKSKDAQAEAEQKAKEATDKLQAALSTIPNLPDADVPDGTSEADNVEVKKWGTPKSFDFKVKDHVDLGEGLGLMDFETAAKISGARFVLLKGALARLERALANFMLDQQTGKNGYMEINPPALVKDSALYGTGQLPKFAEDLFHTEDDFWLIPTAEVPLTNMVSGSMLDETDLPRRVTAMTWCFRSEAGSAGKDTRGMIRQHQFTKVEMVSIVKPEESDAELARMTGCAEGILEALELPYRTITLCTGDMGFGAVKTHDIEVWLPGQDTYREISSCSNTRDFQARRMNARFKRAGEKKPEFVHTLNGSGLAVGRCLVAVLENYQNADGSITVPDALRPYMGGLEVIEGGR
ncbi:serine--tRNA ligase [Magnetovibrio blakemorei]|uniref:Serine--tRNA ligase n=1 Tax=Magnetovibrio blakemorei TaxID=28181 RepID=A0A1E5Q5S4_9PROT|nr:serine--tRNA ligase [Magnetovibrio blakemorei]OEJ65943.1 serine--tRNA ligase [Magnetovibrio blakemorei]